MTAKAERIIAEELKRLGWKVADKLAIAVRLRRKTTLTVARIAQRLHCGSWKSLRNKLHLRNKAHPRSAQ